MAQVVDPPVHDEPSVGFREIFELRKVHNSPLRGNVAHRDPGIPGLVSCTMPFTLANGTALVAIGCSEGIWVANPAEPDFLHRVMDIKGVTELALLEAYALLLVLADKVLYCYTLDALDPYNDFARTAHKLTPPVVDFFRVGLWAGRLAVVYKKKSITESVFRVLEPLFGRAPAAAPPDSVAADFGPDRVYWFRFEKEFYVPVDCLDLAFLKTSVAVLHPHGFELLDVHTLTAHTIPPKDTLPKPLAKRCKTSKPLALFRAPSGGILLCYTTFGLLLDHTGAPQHDVDWHGTVHAALPLAPHIVLFKARAIEVREGASGRLVQVLFGNAMRCAWRGAGMRAGELEDEGGAGAGAGTGAPRLQVVMHAPHGRGADEVAQHVYDFVPAAGAAA